MITKHFVHMLYGAIFWFISGMSAMLALLMVGGYITFLGLAFFLSVGLFVACGFGAIYFNIKSSMIGLQDTLSSVTEGVLGDLNIENVEKSSEEAKEKEEEEGDDDEDIWSDDDVTAPASDSVADKIGGFEK